jgi:hypothetical protein
VDTEAAQDPPAGTATFLLTGVERSSLLSEMAPDAAAAALARHFELIDLQPAGTRRVGLPPLAITAIAYAAWPLPARSPMGTNTHSKAKPKTTTSANAASPSGALA